MKIAFNPSTVEALIAPPNNKDITFDLRGHNIFARGVKFCGTDTNTWRDIKINNVSIDSNTLDLRDGSNTTLTNINGVVTINSTWRPVVDNLTSDSTTSSLSAKQGKVLKSLIDGKSNSGHTHDDRYLKLTGGTMASNALITFADSGSWGTDKGPQGARGGLYWTGQSDYAKLYAEETVGDNLDLVIQFGDDNSNGLSIRNKANAQTSYISAGGVITTGTFKGNLDWSYITNKPSSYTPSAHTHAWNSLTHSSTTENQAILTNGKANGWKLYTLNISRWDNAANNAHSHANKSVLDGITSALVNNWNVAYTFVNTITGTDTDKVINKWDEIVNFLAGITEDNKLNTLLNSKLSIYELANNTNVGAIKNNGIYYSTTDASSGTLTNSPFNTGFALINMTSYDGGDDLRRSRLAFNAYGEIKVSNDRGQSNTTETWYQVLTSHNTYISNGSGIINGTTITQVSNADTTDGVHLEWSGQLTYDQYSWLAGWTNDGKKIKAVNKSQFATSGHTHDDRYLRLTGGWMSGDINFGGDNKIHWGRNTDSASISFKNDGDGDADSYMSFVTSDNGNEYFKWSHSSGSTNTEWMALRSDGLRVGGTKVSLEGHSHNDLYYTKTEVNNKLNGKSDTSHTHDDRYLKLTGGTMSGTIYRNSGGTTISGRDHVIIRQTHAPGGSSWNPIACVDTETGTWTLGHLSSGSNNTDFNFCFSTNADYNAGNNNGNYVTLRNKVGTIALLSDIPSSLKNPHALTISLNGTSQGPYDGSTAKNINITPSSIGAATSDHNHDSYYVKYGKVVKSTADNTNATPYLYNVEKEEVISGYYNYWYIFNMGQYSGGNFGTQIAMPYQNSLADSELFIRSADNGSWRTWRRVLHSNNYSSILDSRYYTESEVDNLLDAKLNRQNLSYGTWNPRGYNLAADYYYNGGDLSISESGGKIHISVDGYFWQNEGQYRVLDTSDISSIRGGLTLYQHLSATDTTRYPLVWGGSDHKNTNNSTGSLYKSYDKLSWQTSSQTLYATNIQTENIKHLSIGGGIYWNPYVESTTDGSDSASITVVKSGVAGGTTLVLSQMNDANDTIQFKTNGSARLYHNSYPILTTQNTYVSNNKGYINGTEITQVNNADTVDGIDSSGFLRYYNSNTAPSNVDIVNTPSYVWTVSTTGGSVANATKPSGVDNAWGVIHLHTHIGNYATQLGFGGTTNRMYMRNAYNTSTFGNWQALAFTTDIPSSLKNPYSLNVFGVTYDGSAAKVVSPSNFISQVTEGTSTVTDGTMLITSLASDNGFADTNAVNVPYKRKAIHLWEYIKAKTDSLYATRGHNHDDRYLKLTGGTINGTLSFSPNDTTGAAPKIYSTVSDALTSLNFEVSDDAADRFVFKINYYGDTNTTNRERFIIDWNNVISKAPITAPSFNGNTTSATKLATARTLWGQSFDGTNNVTGLITLDSGSHIGIKISNTYIDAIDQALIIHNNSGGIRFGNDAWDWSQWAGLKYVHGSKLICLGIAEGTDFTANRNLNNGTIRLSGIATLQFHAAEAHIGHSRSYSDPWGGLDANFKFGGVLAATHIYSNGGFHKNGSNDSYVLLGGGGHSKITDLSVNYANSAGNADTVDGEHASAFTRIVGRHTINTSGTAPYNYIHLFRIANSSGYSTVNCEIDFRTRYHSAKIEIRISTAQYPYNNGGSSISIVKKVVSGRTCNLWVLSTIQSSNYNYYDVYYESGAWNSGSYGIIFKGSNGGLVFEHKGTNLASLPDKVVPVTDDVAASAIKVIVNQHTTNDVNYPLVWSNQNNTNTVTENQLFKSWSDLYYNPKNKRLTVGGSIYAAHFYESSDKTLKKNIKSILSSTNIPKIREFDWKDTEEHSYGFIAQELEEQGYGCLVNEANGKKTVNYTATLALTVAKLQNLINIQNKKISNLTKELKALKYGRKKNS